MQRLLMTTAIALLCAIPLAAGKPRPVAEAKARVEAARPQDRPKAYVGLMQSQLEAIDESFTAGQDAQAQALLKDLTTTVEAAVRTSRETGKHMKQTEIAIRKTVVRLKDIERQVSFDQREPVKEAIVRIQEHGATLLNSLFEK